MAKKFHKGRSKRKTSKSSEQSNTEETQRHKLPFAMQSSNLPTNDGGGMETLKDDDDPKNSRKIIKDDSSSMAEIKRNCYSESSLGNENLLGTSNSTKMCDTNSLELTKQIVNDSAIMSEIKINYDSESSVDNENLLESSDNVKICDSDSPECIKKRMEKDSCIMSKIKINYDSENSVDNENLLESSNCIKMCDSNALELTKIKMKNDSSIISTIKSNYDSESSEDKDFFLLESSSCAKVCSSNSFELSKKIMKNNSNSMSEIKVNYDSEASIVSENVLLESSNCVKMCDNESLKLPKEVKHGNITEITKSGCDTEIIVDNEAPMFENLDCPFSSGVKTEYLDKLKGNEVLQSSELCDPDKSEKSVDSNELFHIIQSFNLPAMDELDIQLGEDVGTSDSINCFVTSEKKKNTSDLTELTDYNSDSDTSDIESPVFEKWPPCSSNSNETQPTILKDENFPTRCRNVFQEIVDCDDIFLVGDMSDLCGDCKLDTKHNVNSKSTDDANCSLSPKNEEAVSDASMIAKTSCDSESSELKDSQLLPFSVHCDPSMSPEIAVSKPPLVMQSSNLPTQDGLDIGHDGGGLETSEDDCCAEPPEKRIKIDSSSMADIKLNYDSESSMDNEDFLLESSNCPYSHDQMEQCLDLDNDKCSDTTLSNQSRVMEFDILDEFESNDNDEIERDSDEESDISLGELDAMLEAGLENGRYSENAPSNIEDFEHEEKEKVILKVRGRDHFDVLPEGWIEVTHNSGMPIYLHKASRVCSVSKPYFLGPGSTRKHEIPVSAIPCLHYLKELEKEKSKETTGNREEPETFPPAKVESVKDTKESGSLNYLAVREYCEKRFEFQTITVKRFKTWSGRRKHQKQLKQKQRPTLPDNTKLITCPLPPTSNKAATNGNNTKREFIMNPSGKSPVCILHEYVQHTLRVQPKYIFKELENASTPYGAVVIISDIEYGSGYGSSKKQAKSEAAKSALDVLIPKMKMFAPEGLSGDEQQDVEFFDQVRVEDPRVCELSVKAGQPHPYQILLECLKRNYGMGDTEIDFKMRNLKHQKNEFIMTVGKHTASVICKNKRDGKHRASQAILQKLHPHISCWGSLLRMYGKGSVKTLKEKKEAEQRITELQSQACANKPNMSILNKLKEEMLKYRERMKLKKPIGKLIPEQMNLSTSDSNLKNVEL